MDQKSILPAQALIAFSMVTLMSGTMWLIALGPTRNWLMNRPGTARLVSPFACLFTLVLSPLARAPAGQTLRPRC